MALESKSHAHAIQDDSAKEMEREFRVVELFTIATNVILAIVGIFALHAYYGQLGAMQGQLAQMSQQLPEIQKSADAAKKTSDTTAEEFELMKQQMIFEIGPPQGDCYVLLDQNSGP